MSESIEIHNLFTDPVPTGSGTWTVNQPELRLDVLYAWLRLAARRYSVRTDWLECVPDRGHDPIQSRVCHTPRRGLDHHSRLRELHGRGLADYRNANHQGQSACRLVRATTGRHDRANIPTSARALIPTLRLVVAA